MGAAMKTGKVLQPNRTLHDSFGKTFQSNSWGTTAIHTCESENIKTVLALSFGNFGKYLDISTEFLFGKLVETQSPNTPFNAREFLNATAGQTPSFEILKSMKYLRYVFNESKYAYFSHHVV
ncbi:hypothetical protein H4I96_05935 [Botrytis cinerea]